MKKILFLILFVLTRWVAFAQINASDTVIFDLSRASCVGTFFVVPVSLKSDDVIYAVDFSMKYNQSKITYNSIINYYPGSVIPSANYNTIDSTLRFTSFCMSVMPHDTPIVSVRFNRLVSTTVIVSDFNSIHAYLNGDACSYKIIPPAPPASIAAGGPTVIATGDTLSLTATQAGGLTYLWSTGSTAPSINVTTPGTYTVTVTTPGGCTSSAFINVSGSPLPVELVNFTATENDNAVLLEWTTASEINNNYFMVEKTADGNYWSELEKIPGAGNSNTFRNYSLVDVHPFDGISYYRLKQTDFDGTFSYSQTISINFSEHNGGFSVYVFPNPVEDVLNITATETATHQLLNVSGQVVMNLPNVPARSKQQISVAALAAGVYILKTFNDNGSVVKQIIVGNK